MFSGTLSSYLLVVSLFFNVYEGMYDLLRLGKWTGEGSILCFSCVYLFSALSILHLCYYFI